MKKLHKNTQAVENSLRAYACTWVCGCVKPGCGDVSYSSAMQVGSVYGTQVKA